MAQHRGDRGGRHDDAAVDHAVIAIGVALRSTVESKLAPTSVPAASITGDPDEPPIVSVDAAKSSSVSAAIRVRAPASFGVRSKSAAPVARDHSPAERVA